MRYDEGILDSCHSGDYLLFSLIGYGLWHCLLHPTVWMWKVWMVESHFIYIIGWIFRQVKIGKLSLTSYYK
jgi:hypothetical protein